MEISKYTSYFHDGSVIELVHTDDNITISLDSAQLSIEENIDKIPLSNLSTIKGKLHLDGIKKIYEDKVIIKEKLKMIADSAEILHLSIKDNAVTLT